MSEKGKENDAMQLPQEGDTKVVDGVTYRYVNSGLTVRQWFSHHTEKGPGPGWDLRRRLLDDEYAMKKFGRTFSEEEVMFKTNLLPDTPYYQWEPE